MHEASLHDPFLSNHQPRIEYHGHMAEGYVLENAAISEAVLASSHKAVFNEELGKRLRWRRQMRASTGFIATHLASFTDRSVKDLMVSMSGSISIWFVR